MKDNKMNKYMGCGLLINSIIMTTKHIIEIPEIVACFGMGIGISLLILGIYVMNHDITKVKNFKRNLIKKLIKSI